MAIAPKCIDQLNTAAGRKLTDAQLTDIEGRLRRTASNLARDDLAKWRTMTPDQRTLAAAERAMADIRAEAERKVRNAALQVLKTAATEQRLAQHQQSMGDANRHQALARDLEQTESRAQAIKHESVATMLETIDAAKSGEGVSLMRRVAMFLFDADNPKMSRDLALEVFAGADGSTGNTLAQRGAKAWLNTIETLRQRFNNAGGDVGKLDYGYLPQPHDMVRVLKAGADAWANFMLSRVDRGRYLNPDGTPFNDTQMLDLLRASWETISSGGANKREPGAFAGSGARANRGGESRELHFRDGEAYLEYLAQFGNGSMYDAMVGHVAGKARDIALLEQYGPNPNNQMRLQIDLAERADRGTRRVFGQRIDTLWSVANGTAGSVVGTGQLAAVGGAVRNIQVAGKLAGALLSSVTDLGTYFITAGYNRLPYWEALRNIATANRAEARDWMAAHGMIAESLMGSLNRWTGENISEGWTGRLANSTMKLSLLNAWTNGLRRGFQMTMMSGLARLHGTEWGKLTEYDRWRLESAGFKEADWNVVRSAALEDYNGTAMLTPDAVRQGSETAVRMAIADRLQAIRDEVAARTAELQARNAKEVQWLASRQDKIREAQDKGNRAVKDLLARKQAANEKATGPLLERMALLEAQRDQAELLMQIERDLNKYATQDEMRGFLNAVEDGASADKTSVGPANKAVREGLSAAETAGRRYGEQKGRLERRMRELENRITQMDREAMGAASDAAKEAAKRMDDLRTELADFQRRADDRIARREAVMQRMENDLPSREAQAVNEARADVATKLMSLILDESQTGVINPDLVTRAWATAGLERGTVRGELWRSVMQFTSFPIAMISRHWRRAFDVPDGLDGAPALANRYVYLSALGVTLTGLGAVAFQTKQVVTGKDPVDMTKPKFWARAAAQGGAAGFFGDVLLENTSDSLSRTDPLFRLAGPTAGSAADLFELTKGNLDEMLAGKETHAGAEALRFVRGHLPYVNLWYAKTALERGVLNDVQESVSPGYLARQRQKMRKDWGQEFWWEPTDSLPARAPDLSAAGGR